MPRNKRSHIIRYGAQNIVYLLRDEFTTDRAAGAVNGTVAEPGPGTRTVNDVENKISIASGNIVWANPATPAHGDEWVCYKDVPLARTPGRLIISKMMVDAVNCNSNYLGLSVTDTPNHWNDSWLIGGGLSISQSEDSTHAVTTVTITQSVDYCLAQVIRAAGYYYFIKGGTEYPNWTLLYFWGNKLTDPVYPAMNSFNGDWHTGFIRVPQSLWLPTPLAYDTFTRANGALGTSEAVGPDAQAVTARAWTGTTWTISTNKAINTPVAGAELLADPGLEASYTAGLCDSLTIANGPTVAQSADVHGGAKAQSFNPTLVSGLIYYPYVAATIGKWYRNSFWYKRTVGAQEWIYVMNQNMLPAGWFGPLYRAAYSQAILTGRATDPTIYVVVVQANGGGGDTVILDDYSTKELPVAELISSVSLGSSNVVASVNLTQPAGPYKTQCGLALCIDSAATPANFLLAYIEFTPEYGSFCNCYLDKCVAGVYTNLIGAAVTYAAGATLTVIKDGSSVSVFYNDVIVGTTQTVADAGIVSNTLHGMFSTDPSNTLDNFQVFPRGNGSEYAALDKWSA